MALHEREHAHALEQLHRVVQHADRRHAEVVEDDRVRRGQARRDLGLLSEAHEHLALDLRGVVRKTADRERADRLMVNAGIGAS